jgi:hypothetical protein
VLFFCSYILTAEYARPPKTRGEILVFQRSKAKKNKRSAQKDLENQLTEKQLVEKVAVSPIAKEDGMLRHPSTGNGPIFHWEDLCCDIKINGKDRRILDHVDGWVKPGTTTALMVSRFGDET